VKRFHASNEAQDKTEYRNAATEAYVELGNWLKDEGVVKPNSVLERELRMGARTMTLEERHLSSETVLVAKGKEDMKQSSRLGRSPDYMDAAALACYQPFRQQEYRTPRVGGIVG